MSVSEAAGAWPVQGESWKLQVLASCGVGRFQPGILRSLCITWKPSASRLFVRKGGHAAGADTLAHPWPNVLLFTDQKYNVWRGRATNKSSSRLSVVNSIIRSKHHKAENHLCLILKPTILPTIGCVGIFFYLQLMFCRISFKVLWALIDWVSAQLASSGPIWA